MHSYRTNNDSLNKENINNIHEIDEDVYFDCNRLDSNIYSNKEKEIVNKRIYVKPSEAKTVFDEIKVYLDDIDAKKILSASMNISISEILKRQQEDCKRLTDHTEKRKKEYIDTHSNVLIEDVDQIFAISSHQFDIFPDDDHFQVDELFSDELSTEQLLKSDVYEQLMQLSGIPPKTDTADTYKLSKIFQRIHKNNQNSDYTPVDVNKRVEYLPYTRNTPEGKSKINEIESDLSKSPPQDLQPSSDAENELEDDESADSSNVSLEKSSAITVSSKSSVEIHERSASDNSAGYATVSSDLSQNTQEIIYEDIDADADQNEYKFSDPIELVHDDAIIPLPSTNTYFYQFSKPVVLGKAVECEPEASETKYTFSQPIVIY